MPSCSGLKSAAIRRSWSALPSTWTAAVLSGTRVPPWIRLSFGGLLSRLGASLGDLTHIRTCRVKAQTATDHAIFQTTWLLFVGSSPTIAPGEAKGSQPLQIGTRDGDGGMPRTKGDTRGLPKEEEGLVDARELARLIKAARMIGDPPMGNQGSRRGHDKSWTADRSAN